MILSQLMRLLILIITPTDTAMNGDVCERRGEWPQLYRETLKSQPVPVSVTGGVSYQATVREQLLSSVI